ncbi:MAG: aldolase catalytic domain-containing protein [Lachnospiraceae bacterium]|nr:aldolase catalytic domain-containing protein [Lachnospiraceae bacterium]
MKRVNILDCTLRDGGYLVDSQFGNTAIKGILRGLTESGVDVIECGFLKDEPHKNGSTVFNNASQIRGYLPEDRKNASYVCLADYSRYTIDHLEPFDGTSIDGVRACFFKEERYKVMDFCRGITERGYKLYVQPVDILGYTDTELLELIDMVNELEPYAFSIVDTFGSMYKEDLQRVFFLIHHNLCASARIGFHSHNNLQMSFALSQEFVEMTQGLRRIVIDTAMAGMGRGAGNTNTELVMQYMNRKHNSGYDIDSLLDLIDNYVDGFRSQSEWGYSIPYFLAGSYSAHVNNISYLSTKAGIASRDINYLLNRLGSMDRKRYDYDLLEKIYMDYLGSICNDDEQIDRLKDLLSGKDILMLLPGHSIVTHKNVIDTYCLEKQPVVISVNLLSHDYPINYAYFSNKNRYRYWKSATHFKEYKKIVTSNVTTEIQKDQFVVDFTRLIKCGWEQLDNSGILLLRLLDLLEVGSIAIAGFDGYSHHSGQQNYVQQDMEKQRNTLNAEEANQDISSMLEDYMNTRTSRCSVTFITPSLFDSIVNGGENE